MVLKSGRVLAQGTPRALMTGSHGDYVDELMQTPRRQGERLRALMEREASP